METINLTENKFNPLERIQILEDSEDFDSIPDDVPIGNYLHLFDVDSIKEKNKPLLIWENEDYVLKNKEPQLLLTWEDEDYVLKNKEPQQKKGLVDNSHNYSNKHVEEYILKKMSNEYEIMEDFMPMVGDEIITKSKRGYTYPELSHGKVLKVDPIMKTAIIKLSKPENINWQKMSISFLIDVFTCEVAKIGRRIQDEEQQFSFNEFTIIKKRIRSTDKEILESMPKPYDMIVDRFPVVGDKIITKVQFNNWLPCSFGEVIDVNIENETALIELTWLDSVQRGNFSYKKEEFAVIERKPKLTDDISNEKITIPKPYKTIVQRDPREFDEVITKIQLGRNLPNNIGKVIDVDLRNKTAVISMGPNDTFILSYSEWEEFVILE